MGHTSRYESLVGQSFTRNGARFTVVKCEGATVLAALLSGGRVDRVMVPLADVLNALEVTEITMTELPRERDAARGS